MGAPIGWRRASALTVTEAAAVCGIARSLAYVWAKEGRLPTFRDSQGRDRVSGPALARFVEAEGLATESEPLDLFTSPDVVESVGPPAIPADEPTQTRDGAEPEPEDDPETRRRGITACRAALAEARRRQAARC